MAGLGRKFLSDVNLSYGMLQCTGDLFSPKESSGEKTERMHNCCPVCGPDSPTKLTQRYLCSQDHAGAEGIGFAQAECLSGQLDENKTLFIVGTKEEVKDAKGADLLKGVLELAPHFAAEVERDTFALGTAYLFVPSGPSKFFPVLVSLVDGAGHITGTEDGLERMLIGQINLKGSQKLVRLQRWDSAAGPQLIIQELVRPEDLKVVPPVPCDADDKTLGLARQLIAAGTETFDVETYANTTRRKLAEFIASRTGDVVPLPARTEAAPVAEIDLDAMLEASLAAIQQKKAG